ncbi:MAG TPA: YbaK/EbsC family protein [Gemmatimonadales bacterium]|nr:YbaK/EbsC family protein [Gemmatimonadales bacterium]
MPLERLKQFLDANAVKYVTVKHSPAYTAQEVAALAHVSGKEWAKTVMVKLDGKMAMAVVPASCRVIFDLLKDAAGARAAELATEQEFRDLCPGCEVGAMPPFGNLFGMDVYVDEGLAADPEIAFNAGSHTEMVQLPFADFVRLVKPKVVRLAR